MMDLNQLNESWNVGKMSSFFDNLKDSKELMAFAEWRKEQVDTEMKVIMECPSANTITAVVLTPALDDGFASRTRDLLSYHSKVFVTGKSPFFNESRYFNAGIQEALKLNSKWIVFMCDDIREIEDMGLLTRHLHALNNQDTDVVWINPKPDNYHSCPAYLTPVSGLQNLAEHFTGNREFSYIRQKFGVKEIVTLENPISKPFRYWLFHTLYPAKFQHPTLKLNITGDFCILSSEWCRDNMPVFDSMFIGNQDVDLSLRLAKTRSVTIDFRIGSEIGGHYKPSVVKSMKELFNLSILNTYLREGRYT